MQKRNPHEKDGFKTATIIRFLPIKTCVAVRIESESVQVRDSKSAESPTLTFTHPEWDAFIKGVKLNEFDLPIV